MEASEADKGCHDAYLGDIRAFSVRARHLIWDVLVIRLSFAVPGPVRRLFCQPFRVPRCLDHRGG
jgi:hypothetical protein